MISIILNLIQKLILCVKSINRTKDESAARITIKMSFTNRKTKNKSIICSLWFHSFEKHKIRHMYYTKPKIIMDESDFQLKVNIKPSGENSSRFDYSLFPSLISLCLIQCFWNRFIDWFMIIGLCDLFKYI